MRLPVEAVTCLVSEGIITGVEVGDITPRGIPIRVGVNVLREVPSLPQFGRPANADVALGSMGKLGTGEVVSMASGVVVAPGATVSLLIPVGISLPEGYAASFEPTAELALYSLCYAGGWLGGCIGSSEFTVLPISSFAKLRGVSLLPGTLIGYMVIHKSF